jgi:hypothetical protein
MIVGTWIRTKHNQRKTLLKKMGETHGENSDESKLDPALSLLSHENNAEMKAFDRETMADNSPANTQRMNEHTESNSGQKEFSSATTSLHPAVGMAEPSSLASQLPPRVPLSVVLHLSSSSTTALDSSSSREDDLLPSVFRFT